MINKKHFGKTKIETMLVMLILVVFCISTYVLVVATTGYYNKSQQETLAKNNLRLASSYIDSKINQTDYTSIKVEKNILDIPKAIVLEEKYDERTFQTIIYKKNNKLRELFIEKGTILENTDGSEIATINDMQISDIKDNLLKVNFSTKDISNKIYNSSSIIKLK